MDSIYSYLDNVDVTVCPQNPDSWFKNIKSKHVGFDTESKPIYNEDATQSHMLAIIQIATSTDVLIYRVYNKSIDTWPSSLIVFLEDESINKYCVDSRMDYQLFVDLGVNVKGLVDVQLYACKDKRIGMKELANQLLQLNLEKSKSIQAGDWSRYPLSIKQIEYAAMDAVCCLALAEQLQLAPKGLVRTIPTYRMSAPKVNKPECIINLLMACIKYRKKELNVKTDSNGLIPLTSIINLVDFKRLYTTLEEIKWTITNDKKKRLILVGDNYGLSFA